MQGLTYFYTPQDVHPNHTITIKDWVNNCFALAYFIPLSSKILKAFYAAIQPVIPIKIGTMMKSTNLVGSPSIFIGIVSEVSQQQSGDLQSSGAKLILVFS